MVRIQKRKRGLRFKLASFAIGLVLLIVIMISTPTYILITRMQRETLLQGLRDSSTVLLEGLASSARAYLPMGDHGAPELEFLPDQAKALPEANYVTITGSRAGSIHSDHVWTTNDPDILQKIDTAEYRQGISRLKDYHEDSFKEILAESPKGIVSHPDFSPENIFEKGERVFVFFKPIVYRHNNEDNYFQGLIRLEVSLYSIMEKIHGGQTALLRVILVVAFIALLIGVTGAFIFSALLIRPVNELVNYMEIIRDTEDITKLAGVNIQIKSKDEIAILGSTVNDMTRGLVKAALTASDLSVGKEIQKKFIPLETDSYGNKQTSGSKKTACLEFFGYYEGAKGVSGDYFDYIDLDGRYYAIIKCDAAGKGIPAAFIMIQVATMFINYFKQWKPDDKGMRIEEAVYQINDFIEALGFKERFAAFTLCLLDSKTGMLRFCNAGDNIIHICDASEGRIKTITLPQSPAAGLFPNFMVAEAGGYRVQSMTLDHGDILLLYTDGIEEGKRKFRGSDFKEILCSECPADKLHGNHLGGQAGEEMGCDRVEDIINAVMAKKIYTMKKYHNPEGDMELQFDFSACEGTAEDVIMALVSAEKMFRCYKDQKAGDDSKILVDRKADEFLKNHFLQYNHYCAHTRENPENPAYLYYTHIMEDEQYDDIAIVGIQRK